MNLQIGEVIVEGPRGFVPDRPALTELLEQIAAEHPEWFPAEDLEHWQLEIPMPTTPQGYTRRQWLGVLAQALESAAQSKEQQR